MNTLTVSQRKWIEENIKKDDDLVRKWAAKGPVGIVNLMCLETGKASYGVTLRGVRASVCDDDDREMALKKAEVYRKEVEITTKDLPEIDEVALHIDGAAYFLAEKINQDGAGCCIQKIFFLGQWCLDDGGEPDEIEEFMETLEGESKRLDPSLKKLAKLFRDFVKEDPGEKRDALFQACTDLGYFGFLGIVAVPVKSFGKSGSSWSCSWGHYRSEYVYGDDIAQLIERATAWGQKMHKYDKEKKEQ